MVSNVTCIVDCHAQISIPIDPQKVIPLRIDSLRIDCLEKLRLGCARFALKFNSDCLVYFVNDPELRIQNAVGLSKDLEACLILRSQSTCISIRDHQRVQIRPAILAFVTDSFLRAST